MSTKTETPADQPVIVMTRVYDAPRSKVWAAMTEARHIARWWGGPGFENPVCEIDLRPGGLWHHVMRFPNGTELVLDFVFVEVEAPERLVWQHTDHGKRQGPPPTCQFTSTLEDLGDKTRSTLVARFSTVADRDAAIGMGFTGPIAASNERLVAYLGTI